MHALGNKSNKRAQQSALWIVCECYCASVAMLCMCKCHHTYTGVHSTTSLLLFLSSQIQKIWNIVDQMKVSNAISCMQNRLQQLESAKPVPSVEIICKKEKPQPKNGAKRTFSLTIGTTSRASSSANVLSTLVHCFLDTRLSAVTRTWAHVCNT